VLPDVDFHIISRAVNEEAYTLDTQQYAPSNDKTIRGYAAQLKEEHAQFVRMTAIAAIPPSVDTSAIMPLFKETLLGKGGLDAFPSIVTLSCQGLLNAPISPAADV